VQVRTLGEAEFRKLGPRFRKAANGSDVRKQLTKRLRGAAKYALDDTKRAVMAVNSRGIKGGAHARRERAYRLNRPKGRVIGHGLRETVARSLKTRIKYSGFTVGLRIYSDTRVMTNRQKRLPYYLDGQGRWRHPVFGNRNVWVGQLGQPYFYKTLDRHRDRMREAIVDGVNDALKELQA
jgi:hypothetical protein